MGEAGRDLVGQTLGGCFRITGVIGEGSMATVYRAEQDGEPRAVAIKVMHPHLANDPTFAKRFLREAQAAARIEHRASVRIIGHGIEGQTHFLAMELLEGKDLFDTLVKERRLAEPRAVAIVVEICSALEVAHAQGIVHRDLKPENVMLLRDPERPEVDVVKVLDFGIAKVLERDKALDEAPPSSGGGPPSSAVLTMVGSILGTPEYMSPEQSMGWAVDARADVYSCGALLFHMLTGRTPFVGQTPVEVMMQQAEAPPPLPSTIWPGIDARLEKLVMKALAKLPENRPQSATELRERLEALLPELGKRSATPALGLPALRGVPAEVRIAEEPAPLSEEPATLRSVRAAPLVAESHAAEEKAPSVSVRIESPVPLAKTLEPGPAATQRRGAPAGGPPAWLWIAAALTLAAAAVALMTRFR
jgi:serine/threonine-protein kinase